jgi:shikimate dehydrogenase
MMSSSRISRNTAARIRDRDPDRSEVDERAGPVQRVGLIGYPVEHSLSPVFQQAAFDALGLDVRYELWPTEPEQMAARVDGLRAEDVLGANITVPHKQRAFDLVDDASDLARRAGAVNTIVKRDGRLRGENTDVPGFLAPLQSRNLRPAGMSVVVLGAGGASRAVIVALQSAGCRRIVVANRTIERAESLAQALGGEMVVCGFDDDLTHKLHGVDMLVNATSVGWQGDQLPIDEMALASLPGSALVYDLTYRETSLLRWAAERGSPAQDGLEMLVAQGAESFRLWTGEEPPLDLMMETARKAALAP